jgi:hypothetical protein
MEGFCFFSNFILVCSQILVNCSLDDRHFDVIIKALKQTLQVLCAKLVPRSGSSLVARSDFQRLHEICYCDFNTQPLKLCSLLQLLSRVPALGCPSDTKCCKLAHQGFSFSFSKFVMQPNWRSFAMRFSQVWLYPQM